ncbi:MAG: PHP domain-containing protein [Spirochaetota bacterium]|nr:PHP domain-containing protein [Spirochaetota bacterium]
MERRDSYAPIHCRTHYSLLRGILSPQEVVERACAIGAAAVGLADINGFYGLIRFAAAARERGLKPLYGTALYAGEEYICTLLCMNRSGFARANAVLSRHIEAQESFMNGGGAGAGRCGGDNAGSGGCGGFSVGTGAEADKGVGGTTCAGTGTGAGREVYDPVADLEEGGWDGLWIVSHRRDVIERLRQRGGEGLFAGLPYGQPYGSIRRWAARLGVGLLAYNDAVFLREDDRHLYRVLRAIGRRTRLDSVGAAGELPDDKRFAGEAEMRRFFSGVPEAMESARRYAEISEGFRFPESYIFPRFMGLSEAGAFERLRRLCLDGVRRRYGIEPYLPARRESLQSTGEAAGGLLLAGLSSVDSSPAGVSKVHFSKAGVSEVGVSPADFSEAASDEDQLRRRILDRLDYELHIIRHKGFSAYFLVVHDIVKRIPRTCGRGSAAAGIVSYLLGITHVDPLRYNLFFERFLNMGRKDPPDIDVDFPWDERDQALKYVFETYSGSSAMVADHVTFARRSAIREPARVMGYEQDQLKRFSKLWRRGQLDDLPEELRSVVPRIYGMPRHIGTHPGGVVITPGPITDYTHVQRSPLGWPVIAWEKDTAEDAGLVKIDLLGNRSLGVLRDSIDLINSRHRTRIDWESFSPLGNGAARELVARGDTLGVFYVESPATRQLLQKMGRGDYEHLVIASSIIRPAANRYINEFVRRLRGGEYRRLPEPAGKVLEETYGIMVYQEDVSRISMAVAGFDAAGADALRKVLSKKDRERRLPFFREKFFQGARRRGFEEKTIRELWDAVLSFEGYSFCKPHSASYALLSYRLAWVKRFFPLEFFVSVINNGGGFYSRQVYVNAVRRMGFAIHGPDVNRSCARYTIEADDSGLRVGLGQLQDLSRELVRLIPQQRQTGGEYTDIRDFCRRVRPDMASFRSLVRSGALDSIACGYTRPQLFWLYYHHDGEEGFFTAPAVPDFIVDYSPGMKLLDEYRSTALILSRHPLEVFRSRIERFRELSALSGGNGRWRDKDGGTCGRERGEGGSGSDNDRLM